MAKKTLFSVARELGVGLETVYDHLNNKGFAVEFKPNAKLDDAMYDELVITFSSDLDIKHKADQLILGSKIIPIKKEEPKSEILKESIQPILTVSEAIQETLIQETVEEHIAEVNTEKTSNKPELKVVGKIDLDSFNKRKKEPQQQVEEVKIEEKPIQTIEIIPDIEKVVIPVQVESIKEPVQEIPSPVLQEEDVFRAKSPTLQGLKILGKIDASKISKPERKKEEPKPATQAESDDKKKRKRKKVVINVASSVENANRQENNFSPGSQRPSQPGNRNPNTQRPHPNKGQAPSQPKEISQREIEEKIKSTMAKLNYGGKNKRSKIRRDNRDKVKEKLELENQQEQSNELQVTEFISVSELASLMNVQPIQVITTCLNVGIIVSINQRLDAEIIELVASEFNFEVKFISAEDQVSYFDEEEDDNPEAATSRAPIVTVMGHVDHGKTSLLDYIRKANVVSGEAGGITQHIGAYELIVNEQKIVFLDTPGHEAFTAMRARGAKITDIAVIIIAADDNVMPQTKEAISHAQAAGVPIIFAINKIDKAGSDPERIKNELSQMNLLVEDWGGNFQSQEISSKTGQNIELLLEKILLEAELLDLKADPTKKSSGTVIEASLDKGRGYVSKILVQNGTLNQSDYIVAGEYSGRIKAMFNERGKKVKSAGPSTPVLVLGLTGAPQAGEKFKEFENEQDARQLAAKRAQINREQSNRANKRISLDEIGRRLALGTFKELNLIVKGDVDGSIEALTDSLIKLSIEKVQVNVIHKAVGQIIESDVLLATASDAIIFGFQVRPSLGARKLAEKEGVQIKTYSIIYDVINEVKAAIEGLLEPTQEENIIGQIAVRDTFKQSKIGTIIGGYVEEGKFTRNTFIRVIRDGIVIFPTKEGAHGEISSLKRFKDDAKEVKAGLECGLTIKNFNDIKIGDYIEGYEILEVKQTIS